MTRALVFLLTGVAAFGQTKLTLRDALDQASQMNPSVQQAKLRVLESKAGVQLVQSKLQPQVNAIVSGTYQTTNFQGIGLAFPGFPERVGPFRTFNARPAATQTVIDLSLLSEVRAWKERVKVAEYDHAMVREETLLAVLQLYLQALQAESRVTAADARLKTAEAVWKQTQDLESAGAASKMEIARAEERMETERAAKIAAQRDRDTLSALLIETIGLDADRVVLDIPPPTLSWPAREASIESANALRPELRAAEARGRVADLERLAAERERLPKLQAFGDFGVLGRGPNQSLSTYAVGATLSIPLWTGRRIEAQIEAASVRARMAEQELRRAKLQIAREVRQAEIEWEAAQAATTSAERATAAARTTLELARLRFAAGLATNIDTVIAQGALAEAEDREIQVRYQVQLARARLARAEGDVYRFLN